ncbi:MAG TPA: hypothetical protein VL309_04845 [Vicinamibacterales bacterium]|nr:hypothetical protein [Vicinamibacterales bacterium]
MNVRRSLAAAICSLILAACGSSSSSPTPSVPQYGGSWSGTYVISGCNQTGGMSLVNICGSLGNSAPYGLTLTQNGTSVTGSFALGTISFANTGGTIASGGSLALTGTNLSNGITIVVNWALNLTASTLTGTLSQNWTSDTLSGQVNIVGSISNASRSASLAPIRFVPPSSLADLVHAISTAPK